MFKIIHLCRTLMFTNISILFLNFIIYSSICGESQTLSHTIPQLKHFEVIDSIDIRHTIVKRSATYVNNTIDNELNESDSVLKVSFRAINRDFNLLLNTNRDILYSQFNAYTIDKYGRKKAISVDFNEFFTGKVDGIKGSSIRAHIESNGLMTATIDAINEVYEVEPIWRHLPNYNNSSSMIVFRHSDIMHSWNLDNNNNNNNNNNTSTKFCDFIKISDNLTNSEFEFNERIRRKRQTYFDLKEIIIGEEDEEFVPIGTHCAVVLVADYLFYREIGNSDQKTTINYLIHIIDRVNNIFNNTEWKDDVNKHGFKGMGFWIKEIVIHTEPSVEKGHYNSEVQKWSVRDLLEAFSLNEENSQFCLAHLFTHRTFDKSVLGLAYVASPRSTSVGGICSPSYSGPKGDQRLYLNTGLTTTRNSFTQRIITREAVLVTAHEFGHNWGSEHDPHTQECSPPSKSGGSYIMYTYSVSGYDQNNKIFSPCSKRSIRAVLIQKSHRCFSKPDKAYCGNSKVEADEECDEGILAKGQDYISGLCCDNRCKLLPGAYCSDKNSQCCASCRIMPLGQVCKDRDQNNCKQESYCDGVSDNCPEASPTADNTQCLDRGQCIAGKCVSYCQAMGQLSCMCDNDADACYRCCRYSLNGSCFATEPREALADGTPCKYGFCENRRCEKAVQDFIERIWDVIEDIDINTFFNVMKDNIVGAVICISLIFWIPISYAISYYDKKLKKELKRRDFRRSVSIGSNRRLNRRQFSNRLMRPSIKDISDEFPITQQRSQVFYPQSYQT